MRARSGMFMFRSAIVLAAVAGLAAPAFAQDSTASPPPAAEPNPGVHHRVAPMGGSGPGLGIGAAAFLSGPVGPEVVYDFGVFHLEGLIGFIRTPANGGPNAPSNTVVNFGLGGWYHLNMGDSSDFSLGGTLGFSHASQSPGGSNTAVSIDPGAMIRAFVTPNVAIHGRVCFVLSFDNAGSINEKFALAGNILSGFGMTYFFR